MSDVSHRLPCVASFCNTKSGFFPLAKPKSHDDSVTALAAVLFVTGLVFGASVQAQTTWSGLSATISSASAGGTVSLGNDIAYDNGDTITLGKSLTLQSSMPGMQRTIAGGGSFSLFSTSGANTTITLGDLTLTQGGGIGSALNLTSGTVHAVAGSTLTLTNNTFTGNGAMYVNNSGGTTLNNLEVTNNIGSDGYGGALYNIGKVTIAGNAIFTGNVSHQNGGGIYSYQANANLSIGGKAIFTANTARYNGGALYVHGTAKIEGEAVFTENRSDGGGALYNIRDNSSVTFAGPVTFSGNQGRMGGALFNDASNGLIAFAGPVDFSGNHATDSAGAIRNGGPNGVTNPRITFGSASTPVTVTFKNNTSARNAPAIHNATDSGVIIFYGDAYFHNNTTKATSADSNGGALDNNGIVTITGDVEFTGNTSPLHGGATYNRSESSVINIAGNATYASNSSLGSGGAHYAGADSTLVVGGDASFIDNTARGQGGAIYNDSTQTLTLNVLSEDRVYSGNKAYGSDSSSTPSAGAGGFLYSNVASNTVFNVAGGRTLTIGTCLMDGIDSFASNSSSTITKSGGGHLVLKADNRHYLGLVNVDAGTLRAEGCGNTLPSDAAYTVASGATLSAYGYAQTVRTLDSAGVVQTGSDTSAPGNTLTVSGNYTGNPGSQLRVNTVLGDSASPTDRLAVSGVFSGTTELRVNNIGGAGAPTMGDGILVVQATGASSGVFTMAPVVAGNYIYKLAKVGNNWYLQSALMPAVKVTKVVAGAIAAAGGQSFSIAVNCGSHARNMTLTHNDSDTLYAPEGSSCTVTEVAPIPPAGYGYSVGVSHPSFTLSPSGQEITVTNTLTGIAQSITVAKVVRGDMGGYSPGGTFEIELNCGAAYRRIFYLANGESDSLDVPNGTQCTVTESAPADPTGYHYSTSIDHASFIVEEGGKSVTVTNTLTARPQDITVAKILEGATGGYDDATFHILVDCGAGGSHLYKLKASQSATWQAPTGANCTVSETPATAPAGYHYGTPHIEEESFIVPGTGAVNIAVTNTLTATEQPITLRKTISGDTGGYDGQTFEITLDCDSFAGKPQIVELARNESRTIWVPTGANCTVSETGPASPTGYEWGTPHITPESFIVPAGGKTVIIDNALTTQNQTITVTKTVTGDIRGYPAGSTFAITVDCGKDGSSILNLSHGASGTFNAPTNAECTVAEATPANPAGYRWGTAEIEPREFTVSAGGKAVQVRNTLTALKQTITVSKHLSGDTGGYPDADTFTVTIACDAQEAKTFHLHNNGSDAFTVPTGVHCTVTEQLPAPPAGYGYETLDIHPARFDVPAGGQTVSVSNALTAQDQPITITKVVTGDTYGYNAGSEFEITLSCTKAGTHALRLANGASGTLYAPTADYCTVSESVPANPPGFEYGAPAFSQPAFTVAAGGNSIVVTNTLSAKEQKITLQKSLSGNTGGYVTGASFDITVTCIPPNAQPMQQTIALADAQSDDSISAPTGSVCTVTEDPIASGNAQAGYSWGTATIQPQDFILDEGGEQVRITNTLTADGQNITLQKVLGGAAHGEAPGTQYALELQCGSAAAQSLKLAAGSSGTLSATTGELCKVTETPPSPPAGYDYAAAQITPKSFTVAAGGNEVLIANSLVAQPQTITVSKIIDGDTDGYISGKSFTITVTCTPPGEAASSTLLSLAGSTNSDPVPTTTGALCTVSESIAPDTAKAGYAWNAPSIEPPEEFIVQAGANTVKVTNTLSAQSQTITVHKTLAGATAAYDNQAFSIAYKCTSGTQGSLLLTPAGSGGGDLVASGNFTAPTDSRCTVSEDALPTAPPGYAYGTPAISEAEFTVPGNGDKTITVTNTLAALEQTVTITKVLDGATAAYDGQAFTIAYNCNDGATTGNVELSPDSASGFVTSDHFTAPTDSRCTISENTLPEAPPGYQYTKSIASPGEFTVQAGGTTVKVTNTLVALEQTVTIAKTVTGDTAGLVPGSAFGIKVDCAAAFSQTFDLGNGDTKNLQIPTGSECTITEESAPAAQAGYSYGPPEFAPSQSFTVEFGGGTYTITNGLVAAVQTLTLTKTVMGDTAGYKAETFTINVNCGGALYQVTLAKDGTDSSITAPTGASCTVTEVPPTPPAGYTYAAPQYSIGPSFTMPPNGQAVDITNRLVRNEARAIPLLSLWTLFLLATGVAVFAQSRLRSRAYGVLRRGGRH